MKTKTEFFENNGISLLRLAELKIVAKQYGFYLQQAAAGKSGGTPSTQYAERARAIETAAKAAGGNMWPYIIQSVSYERGFDRIMPPCGENKFHAIRRQFFVELNELIYRKEA